MKKFISYIMSFLVIFILLLLCVIISSSYVDRSFSDFKLKSNPKYIILGHSHSQNAYNDSLISDFENASQYGESYFYTYFKTKEILKQNPSLEYIFIEFTNNQITLEMDKWIWDDKYLTNKYQKYSSYLPLSEQLFLFKNNPSGFTNSLSSSTKSKIEKFIQGKFGGAVDIGGYNYLVRQKTDSIINSFKLSKKKTVKIQKAEEISEINLFYLNKLIDLCKKNNKKVVFVRSPLHQKYLGYENERVYSLIRNQRYGEIDYLDFSKFPLTNDQFGDLQHVNHKGAKVFSIWFSNLLKNNILEKNNKQKYIDDEILKFNKNLNSGIQKYP